MDEIPLPTILVATGDAPPVAPPPFEHEAQLQRVLARLRSPPRTAGAALLLVGSLAVFVFLQGWGSSRVLDVGVLVGVLLLHESGHWLGMKLLGWRDVRMFFIPLFGAATTGRPTEASGWKEGVVLLLGPVPGILLGVALALSMPAAMPHSLRAAAIMSLVVNAFNLLPIGPLDGGRLLQLTLFQRNRHLELGFLAVAGVLLVGMAFALGAWVLGVFGVLTLLGIPFQHRLLRAADELRRRGVPLPADPGALEGEPARAAFLAAWDVLASSRRADPAMASTMERLVRLVSRKAPSAGQSLGLLAAAAFAFLLALVGAIALVGRRWV